MTVAESRTVAPPRGAVKKPGASDAATAGGGDRRFPLGGDTVLPSRGACARRTGARDD